MIFQSWDVGMKFLSCTIFYTKNNIYPTKCYDRVSKRLDRSKSVLVECQLFKWWVWKSWHSVKSLKKDVSLLQK